MKRSAILTAAVAAMIAPAALAQDHTNHTAPAASPAPVAAAKFSLDTPVETLVADPAAKAVVEANLPGISTHESYEMFKSMSLTQLAPMAPDRLTPEVLAKIGSGLAAIK